MTQFKLNRREFLGTTTAAGALLTSPIYLRRAHAADKPLVGVCFGHQVIAHALGGHAEKWSGGWGLGVYDLTLHDAPGWMPHRDSVKLIHIHQDQVVAVPQDDMARAIKPAPTTA